MIRSIPFSHPFNRHYRRWSQPGISDAVSIARSTFVSQSVASASRPGRVDKRSPGEVGLSLSEIVDELRRFTDSRDNKSQSIVLAGVCQLAKEKYSCHVLLTYTFMR